MREDFFNKRNEKIQASEILTQKKSLKRQKKKERQKQLKKKINLLKKLGDNSDDDEGEANEEQSVSQQINNAANPVNQE